MHRRDVKAVHAIAATGTETGLGTHVVGKLHVTPALCKRLSSHGRSGPTWHRGCQMSSQVCSTRCGTAHSWAPHAVGRQHAGHQVSAGVPLLSIVTIKSAATPLPPRVHTGAAAD